MAGIGSEESAFAAFRHGGTAGDGHYRVWGKAFSRDESVTPEGHTANDYWRGGRLGFRGDWAMGEGHRLTLSAQAYAGPTGDQWQIPSITSPQGVNLTNMRQTGQGGHLLARNEWTLAGGSEAAVQAYVDMAELEIQGAFKEQRTTVDLDFQHQVQFGERNDVIWGLGYRYSHDNIDSSGIIHIQPESRSFTLASSFVQRCV